MIFEMLATLVKPSRFLDFIDDGARTGFDLVRRHMPAIGLFRAGSGNLNQLFQLAAYDDYAQRAHAIEALAADPDWRAFRRDEGCAVVSEEATILNPAAFSPINDRAGLDAALASGADRGHPMLFELRTYTARPGQMPLVMKTLSEEGNPLTHQFVEWPVAYFTAETGLANRVMMLWAYGSAAERARRKALMLPDPRFQELGSRFNHRFAEQRSDFLVPLSFSPLR